MPRRRSKVDRRGAISSLIRKDFIGIGAGAGARRAIRPMTFFYRLPRKLAGTDALQSCWGATSPAPMQPRRMCTMSLGGAWRMSPANHIRNAEPR